MPEAEDDLDLSDSISQVVNLVRRRRWWILTPACFIALATVGATLLLPNRYTSEATLVVVEQQVPQRYVEPGLTITASDAVEAMTHEVLSRTRMLGIIDHLNLYQKERRRLTPEAIVQRMRKDVGINPLGEIPGRSDVKALRITFDAENPQLAQSVTSQLTSLFIEQNLESRGNQANRTANFLTEQLEAAKLKLAEQEQRLRDFKMGNISELPEQQQANIGIITDLRMQLQATMASLSRAQQQRTALDSSISGNVAVLQSQLSTLLSRFTPKHADVIKKNQEIARMQSLLERLRTGSHESGAQVSGTSAEDPSIIQLSNQMDANASEIEYASKEEKRLRAELVKYQTRLNLAPLREQQLAGIVRDYEIYKKEYTDFLNKQLQSRLTVSLEERQEGRQFRLVDPPTLPGAPSSPKRLKISLGGAAAGLFVGLALAFLMDFKKRCFHSEKEISRSYSLPLVVGVPLLLTPSEQRGCSRRIAFEWLTAIVMALAVFGAEFYIYGHR